MEGLQPLAGSMSWFHEQCVCCAMWEWFDLMDLPLCAGLEPHLQWAHLECAAEEGAATQVLHQQMITESSPRGFESMG